MMSIKKSSMAINAKKSAIIGISILNSHFTQQNIQQTAELARGQYAKIFFMLPDKPATHTLAGYGYSKQEADRTVRRKFRVLEKRCRASVENLRLPDAKIVRWNQFETSENYLHFLADLQSAYHNDPDFKHDATATVRLMYEQSQYPKKQSLSLEEQVNAGLPFLLQELAFILSSPTVLNVEGTEYLYHKDMPILSKLLAGSYQFQPLANVSFAMIVSE